MLNKNIYEQEKDFEEFNTYQNLKSKIVSKFLPFSSIFQFFIFDRDKLKTFLIEYYNIHIKLRDLYYILFSFIDLPEMNYLKSNRKPLTRAFKTIDLFNISRFSNIANFLNDEFNKKISEISNENQELFLEKIKIISELIGKIEKTEDFLSYSDSSLSRKNLQELNSFIYDQGISLWDSIENFRLNTDEYNKFEFYNSPKISFLSDSIDCLKKLDYPEEQIQKFIGWELLLDKSKFYLTANTSSYSNNMYYSDNIENTNSIRNLFIENTSDPEIAVSNLFSIISSFPTLVPAKYQGDGRYTENIYYFDGQDSISPIKFKNIEYYGPSMLFFPEQTWTNRNEFYIGFLYLQGMWTFGSREVFSFISQYISYFFDYINKNGFSKIEETSKKLEKYDAFMLDQNLNYLYILEQNIDSTIEKLKKNVFELKNVLFFPKFKNKDEVYFKLNLTSFQKKSLIDQLITEDFGSKFKIDSKNFINNIQNAKIKSSVLENVFEDNIPKYFSNELSEQNNPTSENLLNSLVSQMLSLFNPIEFNNLSNIINSLLFTSSSSEDKRVTSLVFPLNLNQENNIGFFLLIFDLDLIDFHFSNGSSIIDLITPLFNIVEQFLSQVEKDIYIDLNTKISNDLLMNKNSNLIESLNINTRVTSNTSIFPSFYFINQDTHPDTFNSIVRTLSNPFIDKKSDYQELMVDIENLNSLKLDKILTCGIFNKEELKLLKAVHIFYLDKFEGRNISKPIIFILGFKSNNIFLYQNMYKNHFISFIKEYIYSFLRKEEIISLKNTHEMMFGMLEHKINNDIIAYDPKLKEIQKLFKKNLPNQNSEDYALIEEHLNFIIASNSERGKTLKAIRPLFLDNQKTSGQTINIQIADFFKEEIEKARQVKVAIDELRLEKWKSFQYKITSNLENIEIYNESNTFISFIIFELLNNAIKYKNWNIKEDNDIEFIIKEVFINKERFLLISVANNLTEKSILKFSNSENLTKIFEKGKRLDDSNSTTGSGLGLYIIRSILERLFNGKLEGLLEGKKLYINCYLKSDSI